MTKARAYLAGKMRGIKDNNYPLFNRVSNTLRNAGWDIVNPAETDNGSTGKPDEFYLREAYRMLLDCEAIAMLPGWNVGGSCAIRERDIAKDLGMPVYDVVLDPFCSLQLEQPETVLQEAQRLVYGARNNTYGPPSDDFGRTAKMWSAMGHRIHEPKGNIREVEAHDVGLAMVCVKLSRECNAHRRDNLVDAAGYAGTVSMCHGD